MRRIQVNVEKIEPGRFNITAKLKPHNTAKWQHLGGTTVRGKATDVMKEARRIGADLKEEFKAESYEVVHGA